MEEAKSQERCQMPAAAAIQQPTTNSKFEFQSSYFLPSRFSFIFSSRIKEELYKGETAAEHSSAVPRSSK
jgi:hypothetical protein